MQTIVRCPNCGKSILAKTGAGPTSETVTTELKTCTGCQKKLEISVRITVKVTEPETAKK